MSAEEALLGSLVIAPSFLSKARASLSGPSFSVQAHAVIWGALCELDDNRRSIDLVTVASTLESHNMLESAGGYAYLSSLLDHGGDPDAVGAYSSLIQEAYTKRALGELGRRLIAQSDGGTSPYKVLQDTREAIDKLSAAKVDSRILPTSKLLALTQEAIDAAVKLGGALPGASTGFGALDSLTGGLQRTDFWIIGARPSVGKSSAAINLAHAVCSKGKSVLLFSLEMSAVQVGLRFRSMDAGVDLQRLRFGIIHGGEERALLDSNRRMANWKLYVDDTPALTLDTIRAKAMTVKANSGLDVLIVDYIGIMGGGSGGDPRALEVSKIAAGLKVLAKDLDCTVVGLSQLRRMNESDDREPALSDLKESGGLEENADVVILLHRRSDTADAFCEWGIKKQRNGPTGSITLAWHPSTASFKDFVQVEDRNESSFLSGGEVEE